MKFTQDSEEKDIYQCSLIVMKGFAGSGKSTLARALSRQFGWPLVDKDEIKDLLDGHAQAAGPLAYAIMFNIARSLLLQGFNVICDSPASGERLL